MMLETFFENFELLTDASNATTKLREIILQLAASGKLVPQESNDEPASVLLEKIQAEKERAILANQFKRSKVLPSIKEDEEPYSLPIGWKWAKVSDICFQVTDGVHRTPSYTDSGVPFLSVNNLKNNKISFDDCKYISLEEHIKLTKRCKPEFSDILLGKVGSIGVCDVITTNKEFSIFVQLALLKVVRPFIDSFYIKHIFLSEAIKQQIFAGSAGSALQYIGIGKIQLLMILIPPLAEQKRIVEKCERLMSLCDQIEVRQQKRQESIVRMNESAIAQLLSSQNPDEFRQHWQRICNNFDLLYSIPETISKLRQVILQLAVQGKLVRQDPNDEPASTLLERIFAEKKRLLEERSIKNPLLLLENVIPYEVPSSWAWVRFGEVILDIEAGVSPLCEKYPKNSEEWGVIKISAISWDVFNQNENKELPVGVEPRKEYEIKAGDFLISRANTSQLVGKSVVVENTPPRLLLNDKTLRVFFTGFSDRRFFNLYNNSLVARAYYAEQGTGTSYSMRNITREQIRNLLVPVPPLAEQKRIVAKVDRFMSLCDTLEAKLKEARSRSEMLMEVAAKQVLIA